ncbi:MAG: hypothetical protein ACRDU9_08020 [Acidimicrobiia bacterium]
MTNGGTTGGTDNADLPRSGRATVLLDTDDAATAAELQVFVARTLAGRVSYANRSITALQG